MADEQHGGRGLGPAGGGDEIGGVGADGDLRFDLEGQGERVGGLLRARRGAHEDFRLLRQARLEPLGDIVRLLLAARGEPPLAIGDARAAVFGLGVAPEDQVHVFLHLSIVLLGQKLTTAR